MASIKNVAIHGMENINRDDAAVRIREARNWIHRCHVNIRKFHEDQEREAKLTGQRGGPAWMFS